MCLFVYLNGGLIVRSCTGSCCHDQSIAIDVLVFMHWCNVPDMIIHAVAVGSGPQFYIVVSCTPYLRCVCACRIKVYSLWDHPKHW